MIIIDPRRTITIATAEAAAGKENVLHLQIEPGADIAVMNAISRVILERRWHDVAFIRDRTEWQTFEAFQRSSLGVDRNASEIVAEAALIAGIAEADIRKAAEWVARPRQRRRPRTLMHYEKGLIWGEKL